MLKLSKLKKKLGILRIFTYKYSQYSSKLNTFDHKQLFYLFYLQTFMSFHKAGYSKKKLYKVYNNLTKLELNC